ncbi:MAG TPA: Tn3 family transposase [Paraburkholderia sp.]
MFDLLYNHTSDIRPQLHSTDTHDTNQVNYWSLLTFGYQSAPRYRDVHKKTSSLVGRHAPSHYADPSHRFNAALLPAWDGQIVRFVARGPYMFYRAREKRNHGLPCEVAIPRPRRPTGSKLPIASHLPPLPASAFASFRRWLATGYER